uniref:Uncharacterized protein n=1 Tax=Vannella robusta TaxID=1487602 RepID=A0A7S4IS84_9EUKA|mmetsp:Transcript_7763/g.9612  ORF Transcript_7763/g.9612 Transcript_7763/m.9612 type:complete len:130 (+) Transcript_7763:126-515(+)
MTVKCSSCGEENDKMIYVDPNEEIEVVRSTVNMSVKCKICGRTNTMDVVKDSIKSYDTPNDWQSIASFDCRGVEPLEFEMRAGFSAITEGGSSFEIELIDGEFCEFDEASGESITLFSPEGRFVLAKKK